MSEDDFQDSYNQVADQKEPENSGSNHIVGISIALLLVLGSAVVGVHLNYPQYAFWQPENCQYQFEMSHTVEENGEKRVAISRVGQPSVNATVSAVGATTNYDNMTISDQVNLYLPAETQSVSVYGQCGRAMTYSFN